MATYGELVTRIANELKRRDLGLTGSNVSDTQNAILGAIREYQARNWWFLTISTTTPTAASQNYITRPATIQRIRRVSIPSLGIDLSKEDVTTLEAFDEPTAQTGQPESYAEAEQGTQLRLWPTPNAIYTVRVSGTKLITALSADGDQNVWTNEGEDLIAAAAKKRLCRFPLRDEAGRLLAMEDENAALSALNMTNIDRFDGPVQAGW